MENQDLIIGVHSIKCAVQNPNRSNCKLFTTEEGLKALGKISRDVDKKVLSSHALQEQAKEYFKAKGFEYQRVPSGIFLICDELEVKDAQDLYNEIDKKTCKRILCLDQITDVHNAGAILRTASFYGVDAIILPSKKSFSLTPSFFRIASGAAEYVTIYAVNNLGKTLKKMNEMLVETIALSEHSEGHLKDKIVEDAPLCLVLGKEDTGVSNAVMRNVRHTLSLKSQGEIKSLNVSIAAAIAMESCFTS